jgi:DnaJ-class molecular chaperone
MADDLYQTLGVQRGVSDEDLRKSYLKLVKELHPDVNPARGAEERFKKVSAAYDILGDAERRRKYDRGEIDANGEPRRHQSHHGRAHAGAGSGGARGGFTTFDTEDIFSDIFGGLRGARPGGRGDGFAPARGQDVRYTLEVDFVDAVTGTRRRVTMPGGSVLDLNVPEGVTDGQVLRLKGKGAPHPRGGEPGDALIEIKVKAHAAFKRQGDDILLELPVTIDEAVLGAKIEVPTVTGRVQLSIPKATSSGRVFRLKGKGVHNPATGTTGDQLVSVRIVLPETIDDNLAYFLSEWRQKNSYDPGRKG